MTTVKGEQSDYAVSKSKSKLILQKLEKKFHLNLEALINSIKSYNNNFNEQKFREAFLFAALAHDGQMRKQDGIPYIVHPFETAKILTQIHADETTLIAALLHDVPEDTDRTLEEIECRFGRQVAYIVEGITKLSKVHYRHDMKQRDIESMKKLFIHVAEDPRTMLIKLADRLHNMRTLEYMDVTEKRLRKARETLEIFTPIAKLLGIREIQIELEDLCFQNLYPDDFRKLKEKVHQERERHARDPEQTIIDVEDTLKARNIDAIVYSYQENLFHTYSSLKNENKSIDDLEITFLVNVIVNDVPACYEALGLIHGLFKPKPGSFKDYISLPKPNGYKSLHTSVFGYHGTNTKFTIRTNQMHFEALYGIAASYFSSDSKHKSLFGSEDPRSHWVEEIIAIQKEENSELHYFEDLKNFVLQNRINVLTPKGETRDLPANATCIDFAYSIHTQVGNRAIRAVVNGQNVSLDHCLNTGDVVKIITTEYAKSPSYEWLNFAKTPVALKRMKEHFKKESESSKVQAGRKILQKEYDRAGLGIVGNLSKWKIKKVAFDFPALSIHRTEDIFVHIAEGSISSSQLVSLVYPDQNINIGSIAQAGLKGRSMLSKLTRVQMRIVCDPSADSIKFTELIQKKKDSILLVSLQTKFNFFTKKVIVNATMYVSHFNDFSNLCRELERIDGVREVTRIFPLKKIVFFILSIFTFCLWATHPLLLHYVTTEWDADDNQVRIVTNTILYAGLFMLFSLIFLIKQYTEKSFPEIRETNRLWQVTYLLCFFALMTVCLEIYLEHLMVDWALVLGSVMLIFTYLTGQYIYSRDRTPRKK